MKRRDPRRPRLAALVALVVALLLLAGSLLLEGAVLRLLEEYRSLRQGHRPAAFCYTEPVHGPTPRCET